GRDRLAVGGNVFRVARWEQRREFEPWDARPHAYAAGIDVHEGHARGRIVANAAPFPHEGGIAQHFDGDVGEGDVGRLAENMLAPLRLASAPPAQLLIGRGRAVAADQMYRNLRA